MTLGVRGKLFVISLLLIAAVGITTGAFFESRVRADLTQQAAAEARRRAETFAAAAALIPDERLATLPQELAGASGSDVMIFDAEAGLLASSAQATAPSSERLRRGLTEPIVWRDERTHAHHAIAPIPTRDAPRGLVVVTLADEVDAAIAKLRTMMLMAGLVGLIAAIFMSGVASQVMTRALRRMVERAMQLAKGEGPVELLDVGGSDEMSRLAGTFNQLAADLHGSMDELEADRDQLETILERMHDAVIALDADGQLSLINKAACDLLHLNRDKDLGRPLLEAVRSPALAEIADASLAGEEASAELELPRSGREVQAHAAPLKNLGGSVIVVHDVSNLRRLERVRQDFVANVSHELRTPVAVIRANAETLLDGALDDKKAATRFVEAMYRNAERLSAVIADLLDLSRIEAGQFSAHVVAVRVGPLVAAAIASLEVAAEERKITIVNEVDDYIAVHADETALSQIVQNFIDNAIKYSGEGGRVRVRTTGDEDDVRIEVEDDGPGIDPMHRRRVFERFYRIDTGRSRQMGGTGLGLAIVKHLAESMEGEVGVDPAPKRGSVFWVELERAEPNASSAPPPMAAES